MDGILGRCATCRWAEQGDHPQYVADARDQFPLRCTKADITGGEPFETLAAVVGDCEDEFGELYVSPDFGCVMWEPKP